ncbi:MAG: RIO1 family regulatory kinase/ATPase [Candidatus Aenigmatarchaeota archaeon]
MRINEEHIAVLRVIEGMKRRYMHLPVEIIAEKLPAYRRKTGALISELNKMEYVSFYTRKDSKKAVKITETGLDVLSLWDFKKHGVITNIGSRIGTGKESVILSAETPKGFAAIKMHRYNQKEFLKIKKSFSWTAIRMFAEKLNILENEVDVPRAKAQIEFKALSDLHKIIPVPEPYAINRHAVCMELVGKKSLPAQILAKIRLKEPEDVLALILEDYEKAAEKWVHGDFSEFNIMVTDEGELYYIDWPQAVPPDYPNADIMKQRDLQNIKNYFQSRYKVA